MAAINFAQVNVYEPTNILQFVRKEDEKKNPSRKPKGKSSEVFAFAPDDMKKIATYFRDNNRWLPYLIFVLQCNMARRIGDTTNLTWEHFYNPKTGSFRESILEIVEEKTDKFANPKINRACREAICTYIEKTGCDPSENGYKNPICLQLSGTYKGRVMSKSGFYYALKNAAERVGISYNVGTHSDRKSFGASAVELHPNDALKMETLQSIFNHSDTKITSRYIGLTKKKIDAYYDDMGEFFSDYIIGDKEYKSVAAAPVITLETNDIRDLIKMAYEAGRTNANNDNPMAHIDAITDLISIVESLTK